MKNRIIMHSPYDLTILSLKLYRRIVQKEKVLSMEILNAVVVISDNVVKTIYATLQRNI